jgi:hypothetical protein
VRPSVKVKTTMTRKLDDTGVTSRRTVKKKPCDAAKRIRLSSVASVAPGPNVVISQKLDEKNLNVPVRGHFYEKASSRRNRHRVALLASGSANEAVPLALLRRRSSSSAERCPSANRVLVAPQFEEDPNLQAVKGKPVSLKGRSHLAGIAQQKSWMKMKTKGR